MAAQVPRLMQEFERKELARFTPCTFDNLESVLEALAITHCELVLIHPFREGNGRLSRLLSQLMALQAGLPLLNFSPIKGKQREAYFRRRARRHGARLCADDRDIQESGECQLLAGFGRLLVARGCKCAFRRFFDTFNRNRGKHTGTQGALIFLRIAQVGIVFKK